MSPAIPSAPIFLAAHHLGERRGNWPRPCPRRRNPCGRALDESAAEHARLSRRRIVEHAGLAGRDALFAGNEFDLITAVDRAQPGWLRGARRTHAYEHLDAIADHPVERTVADPVDVTKADAVHPQRLARPHHDASAGRIELDDIERRAG